MCFCLRVRANVQTKPFLRSEAETPGSSPNLTFLAWTSWPYIFFITQKPDKVLDEIAKWIFENKFGNETGIVYCLSRKDTENVSRGLLERGELGFSPL